MGMGWKVMRTGLGRKSWEKGCINGTFPALLEAVLLMVLKLKMVMLMLFRSSCNRNVVGVIA